MTLCPIHTATPPVPKVLGSIPAGGKESIDRPTLGFGVCHPVTFFGKVTYRSRMKLKLQGSTQLNELSRSRTVSAFGEVYKYVN